MPPRLAFAATILVAAMTASVGGGKPCVRMEVQSKGLVVIELEDEKTPLTVDNFLSYVDSGFYSGLIFHRVISGFMVQGGGLDSKLVSEHPCATRNQCPRTCWPLPSPDLAFSEPQGDVRPDQERGSQRSFQPKGHDLHGENERARQRHVTIFHQHRQQRQS